MVYAAQPREGTETSYIISTVLSVLDRRFMQLNPARGRKQAGCRRRACHNRGLCSSTPRGDGNCTCTTTRGIPQPTSRFMQLNPARGRKRSKISLQRVAIRFGLCSSTPRGDGNISQRSPSSSAGQLPGLCSSTPRGDGNPFRGGGFKIIFSLVYAAQPREGTETRLLRSFPRGLYRRGLCSSTPRGDGNRGICLDVLAVSYRGLCSSTPRGDGNIYMSEQVQHDDVRFMQLNPARGRKHG